MADEGLNKYGESKVEKPEPTPTTVGPEGETTTTEADGVKVTTETKDTGAVHEVESTEDDD